MEKGDISYLMLSKTSKYEAVRKYVKKKQREAIELSEARKKEGTETYPEMVSRCLGEFIRQNSAL